MCALCLVLCLVSVARLPAGSVQLGSRALGRFDGEEVALEWVKTVDCEEWLRLQRETAARNSSAAGPTTQDARVLAVETLRTEERSRTFASAVASMEQVEMSDWPIRGPRTTLWLIRFIQTYGNGPLSRHTKLRLEAQPPAGNGLVAEHEMISEVLERAGVFDQLNVPGLSSFECLCRRYQAIEETLRPNELEAPIEGMDGALHGQASSHRRCGDEPRFITIRGGPAGVGDLGAQGAPQGEGGASGKTKAEGGQVVPKPGVGTARMQKPAPQSGSLNGERGSHFRPPWRPVARNLIPLPLPEVLQISEGAHSLSRPVRQRLLRRRAKDLRLAETVRALNFLDGHMWDSTCRPSEAQNSALEAIRREVELSPPPLDGEHVGQAAYEPDLVSLPEVAGGWRDQIVIAS